MSVTRFINAKTASYTAICGLLLTLPTGALGQDPAAAPEAESRAGLPESYTGPVSAVAAVVDDRVITTYDVQQRMQLMVMSTGQRAPSPQMLAQIQTQAVRDLVEEQLKLKEAKKFELEVTEKEIQAEIQDMAASSGLTVDQLRDLLASEGVTFDALVTQIRATIAWPEIVSGRYRSRVRVNDQEVEQTLARMREEAQDDQYLVSEICIPVPDPKQAQQYYEGGLQLIEQMRRGVPFAVVAQQFSACTSAAGGGDLGWVRPGELPAELDEIVKTLPPGAVSNPVPSEGAFMIMAVRDKRAAATPGEESFTLVYGSAPASLPRNDALLTFEKLKGSDVCGRSGLRQDLGPNIEVTMMEGVKLSDVDERFREAIEDLERGELSGMVEVDGAFHAVFACEKDDGLGLPTRETIEDRIFSRQLSRIGQQYLRDLERAVHVDIRLRPQQAPPPPPPPNG